MSGKPSLPFSELFADTVKTHGVAWAATHYRKGGMALNEFMFWLVATKAGV